MANDAEATARNAESDQVNDPGYCLQQCRIWAGIDAMYADAATAWRNTNDRYPGNRNPPRGCAVYWTGGSHGYGHIAISLGNGKVRSTDAGGSGHCATVDLGWVEAHWGLPYAGWAWDINEQTIRHDEPKPPKPPEEDDMPKYVRAKATTDRKIATDADWVNVVWDSNVSGGSEVDEGNAYVKIPDKMFTVALSATVTVEKGQTIRTRFVEKTKNSKGDYEDSDTYPALEHVATDGNTYLVDSRVQKCNGDRLVPQITLGSKGGTILGAELNLLYF